MWSANKPDTRIEEVALLRFGYALLKSKDSSEKSEPSSAASVSPVTGSVFDQLDK